MDATEDVGDAVAATRAFLFPVEFRQWLRVAFVTFFLGGLGTYFSAPALSTAGGELPSWPPPAGFWPAAGAVGAVAVAVLLAFAAVRGVMDLVLLASLREGTVDLRRFWRTRRRQGLGLFAFRLAVTLLALALVAVPAGLVYLGTRSPGDGLLLGSGAVLLVVAVLVVPPVAALLKGFTTAFVAPTMVLEDAGVLGGWRRFASTLAAEPLAFAGYAVVNLGLVVAGAVALSLAAAVGALAVAVPVLPVAGAGVLLRSAVAPAGLAVLGLAGVLYGVGVVLVAAFAKALLIVFLRYYALFVLGDADPDLDLVPGVRQEVRTGDGAS